MIITVVDIILILIPLIAVFIGLKKGLFTIITPIVKIILSVFLTTLLASDIIAAHTGPYFTELIRSSVNEYLTVNYPNISAAQTAEALPSLLKLAVGVLDIDLSALTAGAGSAVITEVSVMISKPVGHFIASAVTYVALFIVCMIVMTVILSLINLLFREGSLMIVDRILGLIFMLMAALFTCCLTATIIGMVSPGFSGGAIYVFFRDFDPLSILLSI